MSDQDQVAPTMNESYHDYFTDNGRREHLKANCVLVFFECNYRDYRPFVALNFQEITRLEKEVIFSLMGSKAVFIAIARRCLIHALPSNEILFTPTELSSHISNTCGPFVARTAQWKLDRVILRSTFAYSNRKQRYQLEDPALFNQVKEELIFRLNQAHGSDCYL